MDEAVRPCLRCDALVDEARAFCPSCGAHVGGPSLVVARPSAAVAPSDAGLAALFHASLVVQAALAALARGGALAAIL
jgi:hypothetical protein